ncbi:ribonuclease P protein component [Dyella sp. M7H15-1]|uniref:ribonuclease P protein component n=1 Tax=Dyella sp. M7H15-1 TaxID=2501295 RepID=UPI0010050BBF|nr:ribonuclease P protein component [Dyella sp. M7H15-1]QAU24579.1 ribonuclease P protein component [Dyella sp. M7H15-1]
MGTTGLPREARIRRAGDFAVLRQASGRLGGRCFSVRYRQNERGHARLGLAVSKRVSKRAVERNRIKRLLRESFRRVRNQLPPLDLMVMAREQAAGVPGPELLAELETLWRRIPPLKRSGDAATMTS